MERTNISVLSGQKVTVIVHDEDRVPYGYVGFAINGKIVATVSEDDLFDVDGNLFDYSED